MKKPKLSVWESCYDKQLKGFIVPEAFSHPAKYSLGLIERIFDYCLERGYLKRGDLVGDCFGGVAIGGLVAAYRGLRWVGVELEPKFVGFCQANIALHKSKLETLGKPLPVIIQGDSRKFHEHVQAAGIVSSPPYADSMRGGEHCGVDWEKASVNGKDAGAHAPGKSVSADYGTEPGQIGRLKAGEVAGVISSPPFTQTPGGAKGINVEGYNGRSDINPDFLGSRTYQGQGGDRTEGNIETLKPGDIQAVISSPPYSSIAAGAGGLNTKPASKPGQQSGRKAESASQDTDQRYGKSTGQISQLKGGSVDACISSPPYADTPTTAGNVGNATNESWGKGKRLGSAQEGYGKTDGQISQLKGGSVEVVVSSPPFRDARSDTTKAGATEGGGPCAERLHSVQAGTTYGEAEGQIDNLKTGDVHTVVSSPPWEDNSSGHIGAEKWRDVDKAAAVMSSNDNRANRHQTSAKARKAQFERDAKKTYGDSPGQIGKENGETYWEAMGQVYASCYLAIKPGGVIVLVVKDYVKGGKRVPLCDDTCRLLEHLGFTVIERIHAMLVKETRETNLDGSENVITKSRKSFFRRLAEKNGSPKIDYEEVLIARKPA